jgi:hypothetical protein
MDIFPNEDDMEAQIRTNAIRPVLLNLYGLEEGFSLTIPGKNCKDSTTEIFPYEERELIDCLENGELPWFLSDILEHCPTTVYHQVCAACSVSDWIIRFYPVLSGLNCGLVVLRFEDILIRIAQPVSSGRY